MRDRTFATKLLGHSGPGCDAFYIDERMIEAPIVEPGDLKLSAQIGGAK
jgi:hypothetical protein